MSALAGSLTRTAWTALGGAESALEALTFSGEGALPSFYAVTDVASASIATALLALAELLEFHEPEHAGAADSTPVRIRVDRRLSSMWFGFSIRPMGWEMPAPWDPIAGDYRTRDGWIRLHTNAPHHREAAQRVLGRHADHESMALSVARWPSRDLESAIVRENGCAAEMRSVADWSRHPQGQAVAAEPLVHYWSTDPVRASSWLPPRSRPLAGIRVLDLTRVLAGPVASRCLAGYGATVLRIDPPGWDEPGVVPEVTLGKRCARLDLTKPSDRERFELLLSEADILLHGYRPGALEHLGLDSAARRRLAPGLIDVSLCAYGWTGPWAARRGFDSLVQMSTGIADTGMTWKRAQKPTPLPVQAIDHATGYLMAAAAIRALTRRIRRGVGTEARLSLARTARFLVDAGQQPPEPPPAPENAEDLSPTLEATRWGSARRLRVPASLSQAPMSWELPAAKLGSSPASWS
ncbi:MAG TPA: CoA transferase [Steroidobacteraceae bacterium]|nr:CoA transferase [Steroidobacteraceae bacterium]